MGYTIDPSVTHIVGSDEAGYGTLAGSLIVVGFLAPVSWPGLRGLNDSKQLDRPVLLDLDKRLRFKTEGLEHAMAAFPPGEVDQKGAGKCLVEGHIRVHETLRARLPPSAKAVFIADGNLPLSSYGVVSVPKADTMIKAVMAASVIAKAQQLLEMLLHDKEWPAYGFGKHAGYGTPQHMNQLLDLGPCPVHRRSYSPVRDAAKKHGVP